MSMRCCWSKQGSPSPPPAGTLRHRTPVRVLLGSSKPFETLVTFLRSLRSFADRCRAHCLHRFDWLGPQPPHCPPGPPQLLGILQSPGHTCKWSRLWHTSHASGCIPRLPGTKKHSSARCCGFTHSAGVQQPHRLQAADSNLTAARLQNQQCTYIT